MKKVVLLGSTGSIGTSTIKVVEDLADQLSLVGLAAGNNLKLLAEQASKHRPEAVCIQNPENVSELQRLMGSGIKVHSGDEGLIPEGA